MRAFPNQRVPPSNGRGLAPLKAMFRQALTRENTFIVGCVRWSTNNHVLPPAWPSREVTPEISTGTLCQVTLTPSAKHVLPHLLDRVSGPLSMPKFITTSLHFILN